MADVGDSIRGREVPEGTWTVARLNEEIETVLAAASDRFPTYVVGEVTEVNPYPFGTFFSLGDLEGEAVISCIAWSTAVDSFEHEPEVGTKAVVRASVDFYPEDGNCQLQVRDYWPLGDSARSQEREALRATLEREGLLDRAAKQPLPPYPSCIGVVTSPTSSAREDVCTAIHDRAPATTIRLCGATVQGEGAVPSVIGAVRRLESDPEVDVIVVTRGGGATDTLWCFDEEPLVRAIADCRTPTVVAVGHEDDVTLAESVADHRAMTPTDAGVQTTPDMANVERAVAQLEQRIDGAYRDLVADELAALERTVETAHRALQQTVATDRAERLGTLQHAAGLEHRVDRAYTALVDERLSALETRLDSAVRELEHAVETEAVTARAARGRVADLEARVGAAYRAHVERELDGLERRVDAAYRDVAAEARVEAGTAEARRLRVVVAVLGGLLVLAVVALVVLL